MKINTLGNITFTAVFLAMVAVLFLAIPSESKAYFTTNQSAVELNDGSVLFLIEYKFGHAKYDVYMPAITNKTSIVRNDALSYEILDSESNKVEGTYTGVVLSSATITEDAQYKISKKKINKFLLAVHFIPSKQSEEKYRLQVTHLPFNFNGTQELKLNQSELKYYTSPYTK